ncbi:MAG: cupin [Candidatus Omnitrophica bacterium CG11_big_fil_rev_8_21_14_0_20_45_26]|uniref:Cupin n=1 Tax=Candidatus Abzuiibacterium crystallinum TaxID=1974748 RepID=A0A2H0LQ84_9BACT|nr:MAG: cupin [Candidatus Omnitrophica bacterium CG11_big_fil_rev_8_21_14_0_20_45_26]PIW65186.1 MAG: cupin [Candidatus Omnitrophica bacterium CG12_big_fil_rev_8_21_14_0_65_45_16]
MSAKTVAGICIETPDEAKITKLGIKSWPIWTKEPSTFDWHYDEEEICLFLEGDVVIQTGQGQAKVKAGDLVTFPKGLSCQWQVKKAVRKHYRFGA